MSTALPLDTRQARIARRLLETVGPASVDDLATELKLTDRMVRYNLASVESVLAGHGLRLARRRGVGIWVEGTPTARHDLLTVLDGQAQQVSELVRGTGQVFGALTPDEGQLHNLVVNAGDTFDATSRQQEALADAG